MLSPVCDVDSIQFPSPQILTPTKNPDTPTKHIYQNLNEEISKINARKDSATCSPLKEKLVIPAAVSKNLEIPAEKILPCVRSEVEHFEKIVAAPVVKPAESMPQESEVPAGESPAKVRKVSRFKVSVVTEPDPNKLIIPAKHELEKGTDLINISNNNTSGQLFESSAAPTSDFTTANPNPVSLLSEIGQNPAAASLVDQVEGTEMPNEVNFIPASSEIYAKDTESVLQDQASGVVKVNDSVLIINNTMQELQNNLHTSYLKEGKILLIY